jgi:hypothetical protein
MSIHKLLVGVLKDTRFNIFRPVLVRHLKAKDLSAYSKNRKVRRKLGVRGGVFG